MIKLMLLSTVLLFGTSSHQLIEQPSLQNLIHSVSETKKTSSTNNSSYSNESLKENKVLSDTIYEKANRGNIYMDSKEIERLDERHKKRHPSQSKSITFTKETFQLINSLILEHNDKIAGIRAVFIRYDKKYSNDTSNHSKTHIPGKYKKNQNSIVFVPVDKNGKIIENLFVPKGDKDGINHGEICPSNCTGNGDGSNGTVKQQKFN